ncbi:MAG: 50S ribosomal protein L9 [Chloroflexi bacterium]|nr:MAG: 50S ribosomal protein L9 [Chloroflexota bacterium]
MQVLLIKDVDNLGYAGEVKKVANGFGRNYLIPQELAVLATPGALKQAETIRKAAEKQRARETEDAKAIVSQLEGVELLFERRAGETGKLYGSVTSADIAQAIAEKTGIELDKRKVAVPEPIRNLGKQDVLIKLMIDVSTTVSVEVLPLGGILERERLSEAEVQEIEAAAEGEEAPEAVAEETPAVEAEAEAAAVEEEEEAVEA